MLIRKTSILTGITREREISITQSQYEDWLNGTLIQNAMPDISADDREFIITGITPEEWSDHITDE
jgi:hypothetical protein